MLLTNTWPFEDDEEEDAQKQVKQGLRPAFDMIVWNSTDPIIQTMKKAMFLCHEQDPEKRGTARQVVQVLKEELQRQDPHALERVGLDRD